MCCKDSEMSPIEQANKPELRGKHNSSKRRNTYRVSVIIHQRTSVIVGPGTMLTTVDVTVSVVCSTVDVTFA